MSTDRLKALLAMLDEALAPRPEPDYNALQTEVCLSKSTSLTVTFTKEFEE